MTNLGGIQMALTLEEANQMVQGAIAKAEELNVNLSIAVCDAGGSLLAFNRMEGASAVSTTVAQGKAAASAGSGDTSRDSLHGGTDARGPGSGASVQGWRTGGGDRRKWGQRPTGRGRRPGRVGRPVEYDLPTLWAIRKPLRPNLVQTRGRVHSGG